MGTESGTEDRIMAPEQVQLQVVGLLSEPSFHVAKCAAEVLKRSFDAEFDHPVVTPLLDCEWQRYLSEKKKELKGETWEYSSSVMCFMNSQFLGDEAALLSWANMNWGYRDYRPLALYKALAEDFHNKHLSDAKHVFVYLDISIQGKPVGRLLFELFSDLCPKTCENFQSLCTGAAGVSLSGLKLHYKDSIFHRIVKNGWIQGGDIESGKGSGGESIFGETFEDENFAVPHSKRGILGMANKGRHSNGSQFYITLQPTSYLDRRCVAFGQLVEGCGVLKEIEDIPTYNERPTTDCKITDCGIFTP
ncbi:hypothetical protein XENTR_v10014097 [Xenopus tropicalis]|uniref:Probable inactive peptidyl-prolyl cis-trans isomerase-like 6 n=1 Tax=Xenopus tropicalis TaxID=8364 RepID=A0A803KIX6_XENTR|nr:probable inactive peptidyl-prolyl cis-trans isomerase-like 6 isoform X1 [Xenopus tropicalis]KAE8602719.1 hypothetical protein XENTR_v10014097 [Xenopus tropicalis]|eukprot:XP_017949805.1 PREDICTED: peptidyl-prolyl cis-trans isomerase-like 6 [Xenopus tropicalis]